MTTTTKGPASAARSAAKAAGLSVGGSQYDDEGLTALPDAAATARDIAAALDKKIVRGVSVLTDPPGSDELYLAIQKTIHEAQGGAFFLYFAGHAVWRDGELRLAARTTQLAGAKECVPWSDVDGLLVRERIESAFIVLNVDHSGDKPGTPKITHGGSMFMGSVRAHAPKGTNLRMRAYADTMLEGLRKRPLDIERFLREGRLDAGGLGRYLTEKAPRGVEHRVFSEPSEPRFLLRDLAEDLARSKARGSVPALEVPAPLEPAPPAPLAEAPLAEAPPAEAEPVKAVPIEAAPPNDSQKAPAEAAPKESPIEAAPKAAPVEATPPSEVVAAEPLSPGKDALRDLSTPAEVEERPLAERPRSEITPAQPVRPSMVPYLVMAVIVLSIIYWFFLR